MSRGDGRRRDSKTSDVSQGDICGTMSVVVVVEFGDDRIVARGKRERAPVRKQ